MGGETEENFGRGGWEGAEGVEVDAGRFWLRGRVAVVGSWWAAGGAGTGGEATVAAVEASGAAPGVKAS